MVMKYDNKKAFYIRPEDILRLVLRNLRGWKSIDKAEDNIRKILLYFEEERYNQLEEEFNLKA